jgi:hypothetical protein
MRFEMEEPVNFPDLIKSEVYAIGNALESCSINEKASDRRNRGRVS